jgi:sugar/nucleoside kinase (ribokinase family)
VEQIIDNYVMEVGGSANIFMSQLVKLGGKGGVIGWVGKDNFGEFILSKLKTIGVDTGYVNSHATAKTGIGVALTEKDDRAMLTYPGTIDATNPGDLLPAFAFEARHWHIASYFLLRALRPCWKDWLVHCKNAGVTTSLDTNWDPENRWEGVHDLLPLIDMFLPNEAEATHLTGDQDCFNAAEKLARAGTLVVIKRGSKGAIARKGQCVWQLEIKDEGCVIADAIGAGDNFDAGFVWGQILGWSVEASLALGHRCAVSSMAEQGGICGQLCERPRNEPES